MCPAQARKDKQSSISDGAANGLVIYVVPEQRMKKPYSFPTSLFKENSRLKGRLLDYFLSSGFPKRERSKVDDGRVVPEAPPEEFPVPLAGRAGVVPLPAAVPVPSGLRYVEPVEPVVPVVPGRVVEPVPAEPDGLLNELPVPVVPTPPGRAVVPVDPGRAAAPLAPVVPGRAVVPAVPVVPGRGAVVPVVVGRAVVPDSPGRVVVVPVVAGRAAELPVVVGRAAVPAAAAPVCICLGLGNANPPAAAPAPLLAAAVPLACAFSNAVRSTSGAPGRFN